MKKMVLLLALGICLFFLFTINAYLWHDTKYYESAIENVQSSKGSLSSSEESLSFVEQENSATLLSRRTLSIASSFFAIFSCVITYGLFMRSKTLKHPDGK